MLTILLVRAGRTDYDCQGRIQGTLDVPLSDDGREQAEAAAAAILKQSPEIAALYTGPCLSAQQTAEILGEKLDLKPKKLTKLHNLDQGLWQGLLFDDVKAKQPKVYRQWQDHPDTVCPPEGESLATARDRLKKALAKLAKKHTTGTIALVIAPPLACVMRSMLRDEQPAGLCQPQDSDKPLWEPIELAAAV